MKKKSLFLILAMLLVAVCIFTLVACDENGGNNTQKTPEWGTVYTVEAAYARAADLGYSGTLEEFIALISGKDGADGTNGTNGIDGVDGVGIVDIKINDEGKLIISLSNDQSIDLGNVFKCAHTYSDWSTVLEPTCTSIGCDVRACTKCDNKEYRFSEELGHIWDNGIIAINPTKESYGLIIYSCLNCDATKNEICDEFHHYEDDICIYCGVPKPTEDVLDFTLNENGRSYSVRIKESEQSTATKVVIPKFYNYLPVTMIGFDGFKGCSELESVYIPNSINQIPNDAFFNCTKLKNIHIPKSVTSIGSKFAFGVDFENITIEEGNRVYHSAGNCIIKTESKELIYGGKNSVIPNDGSVTKIKHNAFCHSNLTNIVIPENIIEIEQLAFLACYELKVVYNLSSLEITPKSGDHGCVALYADKVYTSLDDDVIDESITLTLANNGEEYKVTARNKDIKSATIPKTYNGLPVTEIADNAFTNCTELESVYIPDSITKIGNNAFANCQKLNRIYIPKSVTQIGRMALCYNGLEIITVEDGNPTYRSANRCLIETESKTLIAACHGATIPADGSVTKIGERTFFHHDLTSIIIPEGIVEIEANAFTDCTNLKTVYNLSNLDIVVGSATHGSVAYYADNVYTSLDGGEEEDAA